MGITEVMRRGMSSSKSLTGCPCRSMLLHSMRAIVPVVTCLRSFASRDAYLRPCPSTAVTYGLVNSPVEVM
jgi:hypothetical protein